MSNGGDIRAALSQGGESESPEQSEQYSLKGSHISDVPIFSQSPSHHEKHPVNYLDYMGSLLKHFRKHHPDQAMSTASNFGKHIIGKYIDTPVGRSRIARAEKGDVKVDFYVYAAYFTEMGIWPEIIDALSYGHIPTARYMHFVKSELRSELEQSKELANRNVANRVSREASR